MLQESRPPQRADDVYTQPSLSPISVEISAGPDVLVTLCDVDQLVQVQLLRNGAPAGAHPDVNNPTECTYIQIHAYSLRLAARRRRAARMPCRTHALPAHLRSPTHTYRCPQSVRRRRHPPSHSSYHSTAQHSTYAHAARSRPAARPRHITSWHSCGSTPPLRRYPPPGQPPRATALHAALQAQEHGATKSPPYHPPIALAPP